MQKMQEIFPPQAVGVARIDDYRCHTDWCASAAPSIGRVSGNRIEEMAVLMAVLKGGGRTR